MIRAILSVLAVVTLANCLPAKLSQNKDVPLQPDFDLSKYLGLWFEQYRTTNIPYEYGSDVNANYTLNTDGTVHVHNRQWDTTKGGWIIIDGTGKVKDPSQPARFGITFFPGQPAGDYGVLYTDYDNLAVVYSDDTTPTGEFITSYILGRKQNLPQDLIDQAFSILADRTGLTKDQFVKTVTGIAPCPSCPQ